MSKFSQWLQNMGRKMQTAMYGRYGFDELSQVLSLLALACVIAGLFVDTGILSTIALVLYFYSIFRMYSKNIPKRRKELDAYYRLTNPVKSWFRLQKRKFAERRTHRYFRCSHCKTSLRVPRGKGKIKIRCPKCSTEIIKKT